MDLAVSSVTKELLPSVSRDRGTDNTEVVVTDRVYEYTYLKSVLEKLFGGAAGGSRIKTDDPVINLTLLSLMLDFGLAHRFSRLLNLPTLQSVTSGSG